MKSNQASDIKQVSFVTSSKHTQYSRLLEELFLRTTKCRLSRNVAPKLLKPKVARPEEILNYDFYNKSGIFWERNSSEIDWWYFFCSSTSLKWVTTVQSFNISNFFSPNFHRNGIHRMAQSIDRRSPGFALATHLRRTLGMGSTAAAHESFFQAFFFWLSTFSSSSGEWQRFFRRVTPPVWTSPGLPTCRIDRPSSCPIDPGVQKFFAQRRTSTDRAETLSDQPSNPKESLDERPHFLRRITSPV